MKIKVPAVEVLPEYQYRVMLILQKLDEARVHYERAINKLNSSGYSNREIAGYSGNASRSLEGCCIALQGNMIRMANYYGIGFEYIGEVIKEFQYFDILVGNRISDNFMMLGVIRDERF